MIKKHLLLLVFCVGFLATGYTQENATASASVRIIQQARELYTLGRMDSIPKILNTAIEKNEIAKGDMSEAYKLLSLSYIFLDEQEDMDKNMLTLLQTDHLFKPNETDPAEFHNLFNSYRTWPIFRIGIYYGANMSLTEVTEAYGSQNFNDPEEQGKYSANFGVINVGLLLEKDFLKNLITVETDFLYGTLSNTYDQNTTSITRESEVEKQTFFGMNAAVQVHPFNRNFEKSKIMPYAIAGVSYNIMLSSVLNNTISTKVAGGTPPTTDDNLLVSKPSSDPNDLPIRNKHNYYAYGGVGAKFDIGPIHAFLNATYSHGLNDLTNTHFNPGEWKGYNGIKIHYIQVNLGVVYSIYSPKKLLF